MGRGESLTCASHVFWHGRAWRPRCYSWLTEAKQAYYTMGIVYVIGVVVVDHRKKLSSKYKVEHRYVNFGHCLRNISVSGFRGINAKLSFDYPVTAITGLNGAGKSTFGQLALCAYRKISTELNAKRFYVKDFFPVSVADPTPFSADANVVFNYETDNHHAPQELTVSRAAKEWSGYKRQPERHVEYIGLAFYIPKVERKDLTIYSASSLKLSQRENLENAGKTVSRILGGHYEDIYFQGVESSQRSAQLGVAQRFGSTYSENNMGFGEGRVIHSIKLLETCPEKSQIVLEEPETSLHEHAQYEFSKYLIEVSLRRGHQIILSTHSSPILNALPPEARKMLMRDENGGTVHDAVASSTIRTALSDGRSGKIIVAVEDRFAQLVLGELLRRKAPDVLRTLKIIGFGSADSVKNALQAIKLAGVKSFAVRDADQAAHPADDLLVLPGEKAPEKDIFLSISGKRVLKERYDFDLDAYLAAYPETDHHKYSEKVSEQSGSPKEVIETDCIRSFLDDQLPDWGDDLVTQIIDRMH